jgi:hypothetical protein
LQSKVKYKLSCRKYILILSATLLFKFSNAQIANYISNGGFENYTSCSGFNAINVVKNWRSIDSSFFAGVLYNNYCFSNIPSSTFGYQLPRNGNGYVLTDFLCQPPQCSATSNRGYFRNRLKSNLIAGKVYCVKFYVNIGNNSSYGISNFSAYFSDNFIDTITKISIPLTYITPQIQNLTTNIVTDTLGWSLITGTFIATGIEKHCVIGNFNSDVNTFKQLINSNQLPAIATTVFLDDVSCIPTDLPAFAGADIWGIPSTTVYIGRQRDVGIDEACTWYNMSNTLTPIANAAGLTLTVALSTQTYMVKQDICGIIKYDTVVVYASALGNTELQYFKDQVKVYPQPAKELINLELSTNAIADNYTELIIYNTLGQAIRKEELEFTKNLIKQVDVAELPNGYYTLQLHTTKGYVINQSLLISR